MLRDAYLEKNGKVNHQFDSKQPIPDNNMLPLEHERGFLSSEGLAVREIFKITSLTKEQYRGKHE